LNGSRATRTSLPDWSLASITHHPLDPSKVIMGLNEPNEIILYDYVQQQRVARYKMGSFQQLEGISYSYKYRMLFAAPNFGGIIGFAMNHTDFTLAGVKKIQPDVYTADLGYIPSDQLRVSEIAIYEEFMFILLDLARKIVVLNLDTGKIEHTVEVPPVYKWKGIYVSKNDVSNNYYDVYLSSAYPSEIWKFDFKGGFPQCAWS
jgi:hypothetical protein